MSPGSYIREPLGRRKDPANTVRVTAQVATAPSPSGFPPVGLHLLLRVHTHAYVIKLDIPVRACFRESHRLKCRRLRQYPVVQPLQVPLDSVHGDKRP